MTKIHVVLFVAIFLLNLECAPGAGQFEVK
jgi:hypothetical protein